MNGVNLKTAADIAGHRLPSVTSEIYGHIYDKSKVDAMRVVSKMFEQDTNSK